jgi:methylase of polypeptide subunit release factors
LREDKESALATTGGKQGDELILKFLKQAQKHLTKKGIILLVLSSLTPQS